MTTRTNESQEKILHTFPNDPLPPYVERGQGVYLYTSDGRKLLDTTGGFTAHAIVGWSHPYVVERMIEQLEKITHIDYKVFLDRNREKLAELMLSKKSHGLDRFYFVGNSGGEACEAAMKLAYQYFYDQGMPEKKWFISRRESYHGSSTDALAVGDRPNLHFYKPLLPPNRAKIEEHNPYRQRKAGESLEEYAQRSARELEEKILEIGAENVCAFLAETICGGLVGDVPPAPNYWKYVREVCTRHNVLLILDEVWCGTGTTGKIYCCDWDDVTPDFLFMGKTLAAGYGALSALLTSSKVEDVFKNGQQRVQHSTTHQGHSLGAAAALAVQTIIHEDGFLDEVNRKGKYLRQTLENELGQHPFFRNVRGRGLRNSIEYACDNQHQFGLEITRIMEEKHSIFVSGKWHRVCFSPALTITQAELDLVLDRFVTTFREVASKWTGSKLGTTWFNPAL
jgi:adenosylmethionine-8-amino-7-oxononanoate aminotransferase